VWRNQGLRLTSAKPPQAGAANQFCKDVRRARRRTEEINSFENVGVFTFVSTVDKIFA
jgi:hypothetical protein